MFLKLISLCVAWAFISTAGVNGADDQYTDVQCSFEPARLCEWENESGDDVTSAWTRVDFLTTVIGGALNPSVDGFGYGPYSDHSGDSYYAAALGSDGAVARLITPVVQGSKEAPVTLLSFWYHIGSKTANLAVKIVHEDQTKPRKTLWSLPVEGVALGRGDAWLQARMTINYPSKFQVAFDANMNSLNESVYVGLDDILLRTGQLLRGCDFEGSIFGDLCHFFQADVIGGDVDDFDWTRQRGETPSLDTGPLSDHTLGVGLNGHYLFIEATRPEEDKSAVLYSLEYFKMPGGSCMLEFYYHAFGTDIGGLNVLIGEQEHAVPLMSQDEWRKHEIDLTDVSGIYRIAFQGVRGDGNLGDIAIDDVNIVGESCTGIDACASYPCLNGGTCTQTGDDFKCECMGSDIQPICEEGDYTDNNGTTEIKCTFLPLDLCQWESEPVDPESDVTIEWTRQQAGGFTAGPSADHSGDNYFAEAIGQDGEMARMFTQMVPGSREAPNTILSFWYHIDSKMSNLAVYIVHEDRTKPWERVWSIPTEGIALGATDPWLSGRLNINYPANFQIAFEARISDSSSAYVALDDILLQTGKLLQKCDFEGSIYGDLCLFYQLSDDFLDDFDWTRQNGETPSAGTGPSFDNTLGENGGGRYLYIEATGPKVGEKAVLSSLEFFKMIGTECKLEFYYHAFGSNLGELIVAASDQMYPIALANEDAWIKHDIDLNDVSGKYKILFQGVRGDGELGDIAIDDINLVGDNCMDADMCASSPCLNGGTCTRVGDHYECTCMEEYPGSNCEAEPVKEPLSTLAIVAISAGTGGTAIILLAVAYLICAGCRGKHTKGYEIDDSTDTLNDVSQLAMSSVGLVGDDSTDAKHRNV